MTEEILKQIDTKLSVIVRLLASYIIENSGSEGIYERAQKLGNLGLDSRLISEILGTTRNTVSVALSRSRKKGPKKTKKVKSSDNENSNQQKEQV